METENFEKKVLTKKEIKVENALKEYKKKKLELVNSSDNSEIEKRIKKVKKNYKWGQMLIKTIHAFDGSNIRMLNEKEFKRPEGQSVINVITHGFKTDFEMVTIVTKDPSFVMASDYKNSYGTISGKYFNSRETDFVDPYDKIDRKASFDLMVKYLANDLDEMIFPEAVWNLSENKPILHTFSGSVKAALLTNSVLLPTAIERYGNEYVINRKEYFDPTKEVLKKYTDLSFKELEKTENGKKLQKKVIEEANTIMRDKMATLKYEIWLDHANYDEKTDKYEAEKRKDIPSDYWDKYIEKTTAEWPGYSMQANIDEQFHDSNEIEQKKVEDSFDNLFYNINDNNSFMFLSSIEKYKKYREALENVKDIEKEIENESLKDINKLPLQERLRLYKESKKNLLNEQKVKKM